MSVLVEHNTPAPASSETPPSVPPPSKQASSAGVTGSLEIGDEDASLVESGLELSELELLASDEVPLDAVDWLVVVELVEELDVALDEVLDAVVAVVVVVVGAVDVLVVVLAPVVAVSTGPSLVLSQPATPTTMVAALEARNARRSIVLGLLISGFLDLTDGWR